MISDRGLNLIKEFEGCRLKAYKDPVGIWTIGYGHTKGVYEGQTITQDEADQMLRDDAEIYYDNVMKYDTIYHWNQNQIDALTSFAFNIGSIDQLTKKGRRTIAEISKCIPLYNKAGGKVLEGLVRRRSAEKELFDEAVEASTSVLDSDTDNLPADEQKTAETALGKSEGGIKTVSEYYEAGKVYTVDVKTALNVRTGAGTNYRTVGYNGLTEDGKRHANAYGALLPKTRVTCLAVQKYSEDDIWIKIPSGWICAKSGSRRFVV